MIKISGLTFLRESSADLMARVNSRAGGGLLKRVISEILPAILIYLQFGCSSKHVVPAVDTIPFDEQYVTGKITVLPDSLPETKLKDSVLIVPSSNSPFAPTTHISFHVARPDSVTISILDAKGNRIGEAFSRYLLPGNYRFSAEELHVNSGVYLIQCQVGNKSALTKMVLIR